MKDELTYRPRELKRRHDEIVIDKQQMDILKEMMASQAEREQYAQEMREKYPTAEQTLHEIKERYEYENEEYKIIVPESLADIVKEGRALHHCAGSSERYFDRIEAREAYVWFLRRETISAAIFTQKKWKVFRFTVMVPTFSIQATKKSGITFSSLQNLTAIPIHRLPDIKTNFIICPSI